MRNLSNSHKFVALIYAIAAGVFATDEAIGERAYLPSIGSPPLRFQVLNTNHLYLSLKSFAPAAVSDMTTNLAAFATNATNTAVSSISTTNANQAGISQQAGSDGKTNSESLVVAPNISSSEDGLPTVTPEMISEYLKPDRTQADQAHHRGAVEFVPVEMQFAPPAPKSSGESRATYKTQ